MELNFPVHVLEQILREFNFAVEWKNIIIMTFIKYMKQVKKTINHTKMDYLNLEKNI